MVAAVFVKWDLHVRLCQLSLPRQEELGVSDVQSAFHPHVLVVGLDGQDLGIDAFYLRMVEIVGTADQGQVVDVHHITGIGEQEVGVGLQVHLAAISQEVTVALEEICGGEALARILHLRVTEREPDLLHLILSEEAVNDLDVGTEEGYVGQSFFQCLLGTGVHAGSLDVDTHEVDVRIEAGQTDGVLALATAELQDDGIGVVEIGVAPMPLHGEWFVADDTKRILEHIGECLHFSELG